MTLTTKGIECIVIDCTQPIHHKDSQMCHDHYWDDEVYIRSNECDRQEHNQCEQDFCECKCHE